VATGRVSQGRIVLSDDLQRRHELPNNGFGLLPLTEPGGVPLMRAVRSMVRDLSPRETKQEFSGNLSINLEPLPDPENRVTLTDEEDSLGMPRPRLHWDLTARDRDGANRSLAVFAAELGRSLRGRVRIELPEKGAWRKMVYSAHHIGTTRMHEDPKQGVADANGRVHSIGNLYVAGSSTFPTSGLVNPTFSIVALALRLADHLSSEVLP
jgi:choline dehydrogenase-like flavoprotein